MRKIHEIVWIAGVEYRKWFSLKKMLILLFSILFLGEYVFSDMACVAEETGLLVNLLEPMDLVLSFQFYMLVIPLIFIVLLSGFPDKSGGKYFCYDACKAKDLAGGTVCVWTVGGSYLSGSLLCGKFSVDWKGCCQAKSVERIYDRHL